MTAFEQFFCGNIFVINLERRSDRLIHFAEEMKRIGVTCWQRFDAIDAGKTRGNDGCSASHRALMDIIVQSGMKTAFVFEDDATLRPQFRDTFNVMVERALNEMPSEFDMLYLGGHYGTDPKGWYSKHLIRMGQMKTTSSYGVTLESAAKLRDIVPVGTSDSIDNLYAQFNETARCYITEPRFFVQYDNYSDLQQRPMDNSQCMEDTGHVTRLGPFEKQIT